MMAIVRLAVMVLILSVSTADAQSPKDMILSQLQEQGFTEIRVSRTLIGRLRFVATSSDLRREIIINPVTGQILRDRFWRIGGSGEGGVFLPEAPEGILERFRERREQRQQAREERVEDRQEQREERQEDRQDDRQDLQEERQDRREDRRENRQERRDTNG